MPRYAHRLSKSKVLAFLQCPKRLWLEIHKPELIEDDPKRQALFDMGHAVGEIAQQLYGQGKGYLLQYDDGLELAIRRTRELMVDGSNEPIFEATFESEGVLVRVDVLMRDEKPHKIVEVKSSTSVKENYIADCAIQAWTYQNAGYEPGSIALTHIDNTFEYLGDENYDGLLVEADVGEEVSATIGQVNGWVDQAKEIVQDDEPDVKIGSQCCKPYDCPFIPYCYPKTEYPITGLSGGKKIWAELLEEGIEDIRDIPEGRLTAAGQVRIWDATVKELAEFNAAVAKEFSESLPYPRNYLDFETISFAIPIWEGRRHERLRPREIRRRRAARPPSANDAVGHGRVDRRGVGDRADRTWRGRAGLRLAGVHEDGIQSAVRGAG